MATEDNFLMMDLNNCNSELEYSVFNGFLEDEDLLRLLADGKITQDDYDYAMDILSHVA